jgi:hypothetical protein
MSGKNVCDASIGHAPKALCGALWIAEKRAAYQWVGREQTMIFRKSRFVLGVDRSGDSGTSSGSYRQCADQSRRASPWQQRIDFSSVPETVRRGASIMGQFELWRNFAIWSGLPGSNRRCQLGRLEPDHSAKAASCPMAWFLGYQRPPFGL